MYIRTSSAKSPPMPPKREKEQPAPIFPLGISLNHGFLTCVSFLFQLVVSSHLPLSQQGQAILGILLFYFCFLTSRWLTEIALKTKTKTTKKKTRKKKGTKDKKPSILLLKCWKRFLIYTLAQDLQLLLVCGGVSE